VTQREKVKRNNKWVHIMSEAQLVKWDELSVMISEAQDIETIKGFSDKLEALRILARQSKESLETQNKIAEYRLKVERKKGFWLIENMPQGALPGSNNKESERRGRLTLENIGVTRHESARAKKLAKMSEDDFNEYLNNCKDTDREITLIGAANAAFISMRKSSHKRKIKESQVNNPDSAFILGDSVEEIEKLEDDSVHCYLIDPPYGIEWNNDKKHAQVPHVFSRESGFKHEDIHNDDLEGALDVLERSLEAVHPKLVEGSHVYVFGSWKTFVPFYEIISKYFDMRNVLIWHKDNRMGLGDLYGNYGEQYELIFFAGKGKTQWYSDVRPGNVIYCNRVKATRHPTEKPLELIEKLINVATVEGEVVLDSFAGVATTCVAAKNTKRAYIGIEMEEKYWRLGQGRLNGETNEITTG
jgi:DNA modification methylase